jgi:hypothetical protein
MNWFVIFGRGYCQLRVAVKVEVAPKCWPLYSDMAVSYRSVNKLLWKPEDIRSLSVFIISPRLYI